MLPAPGNFLMGWGPLSGGSSPPATPTLSQPTDNGDGTGATASITGSTGGCINTVYVATLPAIGGEATIATFTRTGNGTVELVLQPGFYLAFCVSTLASLYSLPSGEFTFQTTNGTQGTPPVAPSSGSLLDLILTMCVNRLIAKVSGFNAENCYLSLNPDVLPAPATGNLFCVVAPMSGQFDDGLLDGGGQYQATVNSGIRVKLYSPVQLDPGNHSTSFLTDTTYGIIGLMTKVLEALTSLDLTDGRGNAILRDFMQPIGFNWFQDDRSLGGVEIDFKLVFDWQLT